MSLVSKPFYWIECDRCRVKSTDGSDYAAWADPGWAVEEAESSDWLIVSDSRHYCPDCTVWDDDSDRLVPDPTPPEQP